MPRKKKIRPGAIAFWMLNDASTVAEKLDYMRSCKRGGIDAVALHPRAGNLVPYASSEWYGMVRAIADEGKRLDMDVWLYDEDPFPSGAAGGLVMAERPELEARTLVCHEAPKGLTPGRLWYIGPDRIIWAGLAPMKPHAVAKDLTHLVGPIRKDWFVADWDSRYYYAEVDPFPCPRGSAVVLRYAMRVPRIPDGYRLVAITSENACIDGSWGSLPNLLDIESWNLFRKYTFDAYEHHVGQHYTRTIPGVFTDEAKPNGTTPYTRDLFEAFLARYGYDLQPRLHQLFGEPYGEAYEQIRVHYRQWVADRFLEAFVNPYRRYCDSRGLHLVGHFSPEDDPLDETFCLGSVMPIMKAMGCPGTDVIVPNRGNTDAPILNLGSLRAASLRSQFRLPAAVSETLACTDWDVTTAQCRQLLAWQKVLGIDRFFIHGFYTSTTGVENYEAPPDYGPGSSIFQGIGEVNRWLQRLEPLMDEAADSGGAAIVNSMVSYWAWAPDGDRERHAAMRRHLWHTILACLRAHCAVQLVDENDLAEAAVSDGCVRIGKRSYNNVIVPPADFLPAAALRQLEAAAQAGVEVTWFGGRTRRVLGDDGLLAKAPRITGAVCPALSPDEEWCKQRLGEVARLIGNENEDCYVRRFRARDRREYLFAANVGDNALQLEILNDAQTGAFWVPVEADGGASLCSCGKGVKWSVPARGAGLFRCDRSAPAGPAVWERRPLSIDERAFRRLGPNLLRLHTPTVRRRGHKPFVLRHPKPYWQLFQDYAADSTFGAFVGPVPVESRAADPDLRYTFDFRMTADVPPPKLVLDARCARGRFRILLNGEAIGRERVFPLERAKPQKILLRDTRKGTNKLELRFTAESAMDGLLSQLYLEGDFDAEVTGRVPRLSPSRPPSPANRSGWTCAGMPHYMGRAAYKWEETLSANDARHRWLLEIDKALDSAQLRVNGKPVGTRAWSPWQWELPPLRTGRNTFELVVSGTAGNKHKLDWPDQAQGWVGGGWLSRVL